MLTNRVARLHSVKVLQAAADFCAPAILRTSAFATGTILVNAGVWGTVVAGVVISVALGTGNRRDFVATTQVVRRRHWHHCLNRRPISPARRCLLGETLAGDGCQRITVTDRLVVKQITVGLTAAAVQFTGQQISDIIIPPIDDNTPSALTGWF